MPTRFLLAVAALGAACASAPRGAPSSPEVPRLVGRLRPVPRDGAIEVVEVELRLTGLEARVGEPFLRLPLSAAGTPSIRLDDDALRARDTRGALPLAIRDDEPGSALVSRHWTAERAPVGEVVLTYRAVPRVIPADARSTPHFDLRAEAGGASGSVLGCLVLPDSDELVYRLSLDWDLGALPPGARAVWNVGPRFDLTGNTETMWGGFFMLGPVRSRPERDRGGFSIHWLTPPPFEIEELERTVEPFFAFAGRYFRDENPRFTVFVRENPMPAGGAGTHLTNSFTFAWSEDSPQPLSELQSFLAHEVAHSWPMLDGEYGTTNWFAEGGSEYYAALLSLESGALTPDEFLANVNAKAASYYANPKRSIPNDAVRAGGFRDGDVIRVPYGRGFLYLARFDAQLRARSGGRRDLRELVLELNARRARGEPAGAEAWEELVQRELGAEALAEYRSMCAGELVVPTGAFAPAFELERYELTTAAGSPVEAYRWRRADDGAGRAR